MSFTRKVTVYKQGCGGQRTVTTVTQSSSSCFSSSSSSNFQNIETFQKNCQNVSWSNSPAAVQIPPQKSSNGCPTAKATTPSSTSTPSSSFEQTVLDEHNRLRARHSAQPLKLNPAISRYAQEWAQNLAARNTMQHRSNNRYGENLYACFGKANVTGEDAVRSWYDEIKYYKFGQPSPGNFSQVGHFTQVVWKESRELGVGMARNGNNVYIVCNYDPPGNFMGKYASNVTKS
uniref:Putative cysteine-rich secretory protein-2 n=1 Tax=Culex tarsalis TaxID=7177 RepID=A0A1Q3FQL7_CULTA